jgi:hypothetical protein
MSSLPPQGPEWLLSAVVAAPIDHLHELTTQLEAARTEVAELRAIVEYGRPGPCLRCGSNDWQCSSCGEELRR